MATQLVCGKNVRSSWNYRHVSLEWPINRKIGNALTRNIKEDIKIPMSSTSRRRIPGQPTTSPTWPKMLSYGISTTHPHTFSKHTGGFLVRMDPTRSACTAAATGMDDHHHRLGAGWNFTCSQLTEQKQRRLRHRGEYIKWKTEDDRRLLYATQDSQDSGPGKKTSPRRRRRAFFISFHITAPQWRIRGEGELGVAFWAKENQT